MRAVMGKPLFDVPESIEDVLRFSMADASNLSLVDKEGLVIGFYANQDGLTHLSGNGLFRVFGGDQLLLSTKSRTEADAYIYGIFLDTFGGRSVEYIREEIKKLEALEADGEDISHELSRFTSENHLIASDPSIASKISVKEKDGRVEIYVGNTKVFIADSDGEATAFVRGYSPYANKND